MRLPLVQQPLVQRQATVPFTAAATGGAATSFTAISTPGSITGSSATSPITVTGLTAGTSYTFKVYGANASGTWSAVQSAASNSVTPFESNSYESIATATVGSGGTASVVFSSIPQTYKHLQIRSFYKMSSGTNAAITLNSGSFARRNYLYGAGSSPLSGSDTSNAIFAGATSYFYVTILDLLDYTDTNKNRTYRALNGGDNNGSGVIHLFSGIDTTTTATNSITITVNGSGSFAQYSHFALYGIKGA